MFIKHSDEKSEHVNKIPDNYASYFLLHITYKHDESIYDELLVKKDIWEQLKHILAVNHTIIVVVYHYNRIVSFSYTDLDINTSEPKLSDTDLIRQYPIDHTITINDILKGINTLQTKMNLLLNLIRKINNEYSFKINILRDKINIYDMKLVYKNNDMLEDIIYKCVCLYNKHNHMLEELKIQEEYENSIKIHLATKLIPSMINCLKSMM